MMLSDRDIKDAIRLGDIEIKPYGEGYVRPASYDVHLGEHILITTPHKHAMYFDPSADDEPMFLEELEPYYGDPSKAHNKRFYLSPGQRILAHIDEHIKLVSPHLAADIAGISSLGRWFLQVHVTAGFVDPRWEGRLTLEIINLSPWYLRIWEGMRIAQIRFYTMTSPSEIAYDIVGRKYQHSETVTPSKYKDDMYVR